MLFEKRWEVEPWDKVKIIEGEHKGTVGEVFKVTKYNNETIVMVEIADKEMIRCSVNQIKKI